MINYRINDDKILFTQLGEEGVIYDSENNKYLSVNETLFKILRGINEGLPVETIIQNLCAEYDISEEACTFEVNKVLSQLLEKQYISA
ncbi:PqqD family protein [Emticicia sp. 17c]|uniref:PqqD family protein n=1 Tax=Emticicia sp. 17c TaxID=3127704 RepID=UPI00301BAAEA